MRRSLAMATWALGTATATAVAWFGVSSGIASVTASSTGPPLTKSESVAAGRLPVFPAPRLSETTTALSAGPGSTTSTAPPHPFSLPTGHPDARTVTSSTGASGGTAPRSGTTTVSSPRTSTDTAPITPALPTTTTTVPPPTTTSTTSPPSATFASKGGVVTAACDGQSISLLSASPNNGYQMRVDDSGPTTIHVEFVGGENDSEISATCVNGKPSGTIYNDD